ncbi:MAG TPA: alpha/beta fold hydrolase [Steroidobacteraceae bacterium]|nr:alpha/beta fold hydrolase [Steroidobacteraceae bacterium]
MKNLIVAAAVTCSAAAAAGAAVAESPIEAPGPLGPLRGTMLGPQPQSGPVVLIIPGSGPTDRDGNSPAGVLANPYRLLAEALADRGITTVRIDKRGMFGSAAAAADANAVTIEDYVADVQAWTGVIRARTRASCLWLLGHSEGGLVAMAAANGTDVCGLLLVAAPGRPMGEIIREQLKANPANAPLLAQALPALDALEAGRRVDTTGMHPALLRLFRPAVQGFLISAFSYDPARLLAGLAKPVLIIQGRRDLQVREADARALEQADPKATLVLLPDMNHVLKSVASDDVRANLATYGDSSLPLAPGLVQSISDFLAKPP